MSKPALLTDAFHAETFLTKAGPDSENHNPPQPFNHDLLAFLEQATRSGSWVLDATTGRLTVSPQLSAFLAWPAGFTPPETDDGVLAAALAFYAPASRQQMARLLTACLDNGAPFDAQVMLLTAQDEVLSARSHGQAMRDGSGAVTGVQGMLQMTDKSLATVSAEAPHDRHQAVPDANAGDDQPNPGRAFQQMLLVQDCMDKLGNMVVITESSLASASGVSEQRIVFVNSAFERRTGYALADVQGRNPRLLQGKRSQPHEVARIRAAVKNRKAVRSELINYTKAGVPYWMELEITPVDDEDRATTRWVAVSRDINDRKAAEDEIEGLAFYDALTELPNRKMLMMRLERALTISREVQATSEPASDALQNESFRAGGASAPDEFSAFVDTLSPGDTRPLTTSPEPVPNRRQPRVTSPRQNISALMFIDLDHFKILNDTLGHVIGDLLLQKVALRLARCVRLSDTVARLGGDEFVVMLENLGAHDVDTDSADSTEQGGYAFQTIGPQASPSVLCAEDKARAVGQKIVAALAEPFDLAGHQHHCTCSVGITMFGKQPVTLSDVLKQADLAMYQAKDEGRNGLCFFDPAMQALAVSNAALNSDLRRGLRDGEFELYYQPQVGRGGRMFGVEALLRWRHPERGLVTPDLFIPQAEESGLIMPLGEWALRTACQQLAAWDKRPETKHLSIAVNVSMRQFRHPEFVDQVLAIIADTGIRANRLKLELTESLLATGLEVTIAKMGMLKALGVTLSIDDFGMGYSALSYLKYMPLDQLKIDRAFVKDVLTDPNDAAIARTIISLAQSLGLGVVAEGVETEEQRAFLAKHGCDCYQGWLFCKALPIDKLEAFMLVIWHAELMV